MDLNHILEQANNPWAQFGAVLAAELVLRVVPTNRAQSILKPAQQVFILGAVICVALSVVLDKAISAANVIKPTKEE